MTPKEELKAILGRLEELRAEGKKAVDLDGLHGLLTHVERAIAPDVSSAGLSPAGLELTKLQASFELAHYGAIVEASNRLFDSVLETTGAAIKSLFLINGGGCVALLALIGQLAASTTAQVSPAAFAPALYAFATGVGLASLMSCSLGLGQKAYHEKHDKLGQLSTWITVILGLGTLTAFGLGCYWCYSTLRTLHASNWA